MTASTLIRTATTSFRWLAYAGAAAGIIAILVIFVILVVGALFVFGGRWFGGNKRIDVNIGTPK